LSNSYLTGRALRDLDQHIDVEGRILADRDLADIHHALRR